MLKSWRNSLQLLMKIDQYSVGSVHRTVLVLNSLLSGTFVFGILAEFGALLGPGSIKTTLIE